MIMVLAPARAARLGLTPRLIGLLALIASIGVFWLLDTWAVRLKERQRAQHAQDLELAHLRRVVTAGSSTDWERTAQRLEANAQAWEARLLETSDTQALKIALMSSYSSLLHGAQARGYNVVLTERTVGPPGGSNSRSPNGSGFSLGGSIGIGQGANGSTAPSNAEIARPALGEDASLVQVSAVLSASFDPKTLYQLMRALEDLPNVTRIDGLIVRNNRFELTVTALARVQAVRESPAAERVGPRP